MDSKIKEKLDRVFSKYIRLRDTRGGYFTCISCGRVKPASQCDAGHYINRRHMAVRWNEYNVNGECRYCNRFDENHITDYRRNLVRKIGEERVLLLESMKYRSCKITDYEALALIKEYERRIREMM